MQQNNTTWVSTGSKQQECIKKASPALMLRPCRQQDRKPMASTGSQK